jgi:hypothetical protein
MPQHVKCPKFIGNHKALEASTAFVRHWQETINKQFKQGGIMKQIGDMSKHKHTYWVCAIVTQLAIENGELSFQVDYEDTDLDNV